MSKNWEWQSDGVKVSGNYLDHKRNGCDKTNAERFGEDPLKGRTDFLIDNGDGSHEHYSVDDNGNIKRWPR